jgi:hypothetical protein
MDAESSINVTGKGQLTGKGYFKSMGASYAGQGGSQDLDGVDRTYVRIKNYLCLGNILPSSR